MSEKDRIIEIIKNAEKPVSVGEVTKLSGLDKKIVDKIFSELKKDEIIVSPVRCKWEIKK